MNKDIKFFIEPEAEVIRFDSADIIVTSGDPPIESNSQPTTNYMPF